MRSLVLISALMALVACGGDTNSGATPPRPDTGPSDTGQPDAPPQDADSPQDADPPDAPPEDAILDTPPEDAIPDDTTDSELADIIEEMDVVEPDTGMGDAGMEPDVTPPESPWATGAPIEVGPRQEVSVVALGGEVYVIGGFNEALQVLPTVEVYDPAGDTWRSTAPMPVRMHHANAGVIGGKLVVAGFLTGFGFVPDGRVLVYDPAQDTWTAGTPMPEGTERGASGAGVIDGRIYVAGGLRGAAVRDVSRYDPEAGQWDALEPLPIQLDHLVAGVVDGIFYVIGGRNRNIRSHTPRVFAYDPADDAWTEKAPMPTSRAGHAAAVHNGRIYVLGGEGSADHPSGVFDDNEVYSPDTDSWAPLPVIPTRRHGTGAATVDGRIILPGGADVQAFSAVAVVEIFTPEP